MKGENYQQIDSLSLSSLIKKQFGNDLDDLAFCLLFGSRVTNRHNKNSDIDLMFVFKNQISSRIKSNLVLSYKQVHHNLSLEYSAEFPLEILALSDLEYCFKGKGFNRVANGMQITPIYDSDWNPQTDYRFWLCVLASQTMFIEGNYDFYSKYKAQALRSLFFIVVISNTIRSFSIDTIVDLMIGSGKAYLGFTDLAVTKVYLNFHVDKLCKELVRQNILIYRNNLFLVINADVFTHFLHALKNVNEEKNITTCYETNANLHSKNN